LINSYQKQQLMNKWNLLFEKKKLTVLSVIDAFINKNR